MHRKTFLHSLLGFSAMASLSSFNKFTTELTDNGQEMPVLFVGHGSPMNAIENNEFTKGWRAIAKTIPTPSAILCISAHWETKGTFVTAMERPKTIHDFGGFPQALFDVQYPAKGSKWLAEATKKIIEKTNVGLDEAWGLDHGAWSILQHLYPSSDVPIVQLSLDYTQGALYHYNLAQELAGLRKKGVLIIGSGNMVHNFQYAKFGGDFNAHYGHDWAIDANEEFKKLITANDFTSLVNYQTYSKALQLSAPSPDHYLPMIYAIALRNKKDDLRFFNDAVVGGSFSMTSLILG
jgi:4,5-DOPA dioxygenase extradiol